jgi:hypothetical protein
MTYDNYVRKVVLKYHVAIFGWPFPKLQNLSEHGGKDITLLLEHLNSNPPKTYWKKLSPEEVEERRAQYETDAENVDGDESIENTSSSTCKTNGTTGQKRKASSQKGPAQNKLRKTTDNRAKATATVKDLETASAKPRRLSAEAKAYASGDALSNEEQASESGEDNNNGDDEPDS